MTAADEQVYVFLMRHEQHRRGVLTKDALHHVRAVADRFAEWLTATPLEVEVAHQGGREVMRTMSELVQLTSAQLFDREAPATRVFRPAAGDWPPPTWPSNTAKARVPTARGNSGLDAYRPDNTSIGELDEWLRGAGQEEYSARLFVGNDPLVSWLAAGLSGQPVPMAHGELVCLTSPAQNLAGRWRVRWTIAPRDDSQVAAIQAKVKSKMSTAGSFGAVITGLLVFLLKDGVNASSYFSWLALAAFAAAAMLFFAALFFYDSLSMPSRFWASTREYRPGGVMKALRLPRRVRQGWSGIERPPSSTARVLQEAMVHVWTWVFQPAVVLTGIGVTLLAASQAWPPAESDTLTPGWPALTLIAIGAVVVTGWIAAHRPNLGSSD